MKEVGTLKELRVKVGDVVKVVGLKTSGDLIEDGGEWIIISTYNDVFRGVKPEYKKDHAGIKLSSDWHLWRIIPRATPTPKLWRDMTPEEKGALLLARHEGRDLEYWRRGSGGWASCSSAGIYDNESYRIKPEPKVEIVTMDGSDIRFWGFVKGYKITFNTLDGEPDVNSIKMEKL